MTVVESGAEAAFTRRAVTIPPGFDPTPSIRHVRSLEITVADEAPAGLAPRPSRSRSARPATR